VEVVFFETLSIYKIKMEAPFSMVHFPISCSWCCVLFNELCASKPVSVCGSKSQQIAR
jgi:hypothetical protein